MFNVDPRTHGTNLESSEQVVLDGTSKWSCKIQVTGTVLSLLSVRVAAAVGGARFIFQVCPCAINILAASIVKCSAQKLGY